MGKELEKSVPLGVRKAKRLVSDRDGKIGRGLIVLSKIIVWWKNRSVPDGGGKISWCQKVAGKSSGAGVVAAKWPVSGSGEKYDF